MVLDASPSIICYEEEWSKYIPLAIFGILIYIIGIPLTFLIVIYQLKIKNLISLPKIIMQYSFILENYTSNTYSWELVIFIFKFFLLITQLYLTHNLLYKLIGCIIIFLFLIILYLVKRPMLYNLNNYHCIFTYCNLLILLLFGIVFGTNSLPGNWFAIFFDILAFIVLFNCIIFTVYTFYKEINARKINFKQEKNKLYNE